MRQLFAILIAVLQSATYAQQANGCGSGIERYVIPDKLRIVGCDFKRSCDAHDVCYGACSATPSNNESPQCEYLRCQKGGDLYGSTTCDSIKFRRLGVAADERRVICDAKFMVDIVKYNPGNSRCTLFSALYPSAVRVLGSRSFVGIDSAKSTWSEEDKSAYASAINELFSTWSEPRIGQYTKALNEGKANVDLNKPLRFDPRIGLVNTR